jgi:hypothetical protein
MLKITAIEVEGRKTLVLEGRLVEPWPGELERAWSETGATDLVSVDLRDVTTISDKGRELLTKMRSQGVELHCRRGVLTKHLINLLMKQCSQASKN